MMLRASNPRKPTKSVTTATTPILICFDISLPPAVGLPSARVVSGPPHQRSITLGHHSVAVAATREQATALARRGPRRQTVVVTHRLLALAFFMFACSSTHKADPQTVDPTIAARESCTFAAGAHVRDTLGL